jgi:hypothetical protein
MSNSTTDSFRNATRYLGQDYRFTPTYLRKRDPAAPQAQSTDHKPKEQQGYYPITSLWTNTTNSNLWALVNITNNLANWVLLSGGGSGPILGEFLDDGTTVKPTSLGILNVFGNTVANATHAKPVFTTQSAANTERIDVQVATAYATGGNINLSGLAAFDNTIFTVDATGWVTIPSFFDFNYVQVTASGGANPSPYTAPNKNMFISCDSSSASNAQIVIVLPASPTQFRQYTIKDRTGVTSQSFVGGSFGGNIVITAGGTTLIDGLLDYYISGNFGSVTLLFNGTSYEIF